MFPKKLCGASHSILKSVCFDFNLLSEKLKRSEKQQKIIDILKNAPHNEILRNPVMDINSLRSLEKKGFIQICYGTEYRLPNELKRDIDKVDSEIKLTEQQQNAFDKIKSLIDLEKPNGVLLQGVTGSGKTQVYINCIKYVLSKGRNAIILVPELSLTAQFADIYRREFGDSMAFIHSAMSVSEKSDELRRIANGEARVVLGARSAIFSPLENVGLFIIDEEHDQAYKQENSPRYHARHIAIKRSLFDKSVIVFGSATPSLESYVRAYNSNYSFLKEAKGFLDEITITSNISSNESKTTNQNNEKDKSIINTITDNMNSKESFLKNIIIENIKEKQFSYNKKSRKKKDNDKQTKKSKKSNKLENDEIPNFIIIYKKDLQKELINEIEKKENKLIPKIECNNINKNIDFVSYEYIPSRSNNSLKKQNSYCNNNDFDFNKNNFYSGENSFSSDIYLEQLNKSIYSSHTIN